MSQLTALQHRLTAFRHRRQLIRWGMAWSALVVGVLGALAALFALDVAFELSVAQRLALLGIGAAVIVWTTRRFVLPWLGVRETETDVALFVEAQHGIDSDLVAGLQFDRSGSEDWGSRRLQAAVIARIADLSPHLDVSRGVDLAPLIRRARLLGAIVIVSITISALFPRHVTVFLSRVLLLSARHYPSDTTIETLSVNGFTIWEWNAASTRPRDARSAKNRPVTFLVQCSGKLPQAGGIECRSLLHGASRFLELRRLAAEELSARVPQSLSVEDGRLAYYFAEMPRLVEEFSYTLRLGDAWTDAAHIEMIEPPLVELVVQVTPPSYAAAAEDSEQSPRHLAVLEGSRVSIQVRSLNAMPPTALRESPASTTARQHGSVSSKPLKSASIKIDAGGSVSSHDLVNPSGDGLNWTLPADTPLTRVMHELRYEVQVVDHDGMGLESPLRGFVQLKVDRPPTAVASIVHRVVLPNAKPVIEYRLNDDYGIANAALQGRIERQPGRTSSPADTATEDSDEPFDLAIPLDPSPLIGQNLPHRGKFALDLANFKLLKGDQLKLTLSVVDHRGESAGQGELSEPILLEVSDEAGVLAAITEADERSEKRLGDVIKQQLGVGGNK